jgi:hypothetical protein
VHENRNEAHLNGFKGGGCEWVRESNRGEVFDQSILYACMDISQRKHFVQLIHTNGGKKHLSWVLVAHVCNPSYSRD